MIQNAEKQYSGRFFYAFLECLTLYLNLHLSNPVDAGVQD